MKVSQFNEVISKLLSERLKEFSSTSLNLVTCVKIHQVIFDTLVDVFKESKVTLTNEAMNFLSQTFYDSVLINNNQILDPNIFTQRAKLSLVETKELALLAVLLHGSDFAEEPLKEIKRRS